MLTEHEERYQKKFVESAEAIKKAMTEGIQENLDADLTSSDQMGCCIIALTILIQDLSDTVASGTEKEFTFDHMIRNIVGMKKHLDSGK